MPPRSAFLLVSFLYRSGCYSRSRLNTLHPALGSAAKQNDRHDSLPLVHALLSLGEPSACPLPSWTKALFGGGSESCSQWVQIIFLGGPAWTMPITPTLPPSRHLEGVPHLFYLINFRPLITSPSPSLFVYPVLPPHTSFLFFFFTIRLGIFNLRFPLTSHGPLGTG